MTNPNEEYNWGKLYNESRSKLITAKKEIKRLTGALEYVIEMERGNRHPNIERLNQALNPTPEAGEDEVCVICDDSKIVYGGVCPDCQPETGNDVS